MLIFHCTKSYWICLFYKLTFCPKVTQKEKKLMVMSLTDVKQWFSFLPAKISTIVLTAHQGVWFYDSPCLFTSYMSLFNIACCLTQSFCLENELELFNCPTIHAIAKVHTTNTETTDSWNESHWSPHSSAIFCWETLDPGIHVDANWKQTIRPSTFSRPSTSPHGTGTTLMTFLRLQNNAPCHTTKAAQ